MGTGLHPCQPGAGGHPQPVGPKAGQAALPCGARDCASLVWRRAKEPAIDSVDYIYWTFSAAAQSIAAFIALLLTGFALVHTLMDSAGHRDDSLEEVHAALRTSYHRRLSALAWLTGAAVMLSLLVVYLNRPGQPASPWLMGPVALVDVAAMAAGLYFVVSIIDPSKYQRVARQVIEAAAQADDAAHATQPAQAFLDEFVHLTRLVRDYLRDHDLEPAVRSNGRGGYSLRQMVEVMRASEKIDAWLADELLQLSRQRNLVFHGDVAEVDARLLARVREAQRKVSALG